MKRRPPIDASEREWEFHDFRIKIRISYEDGRIDVNSADDNLILAFLYSQEIPEVPASQMLADLRDRHKGEKAARRKGPLETIDELHDIPSWTGLNSDEWAASLTIYTQAPGVRATHAPLAVSQALQLAQARRLGGHDWVASAIETPPFTNQDVFGELLRISAATSRDGDLRASSQWVGRINGNRSNPISTMVWNHAGSRRAAYLGKIPSISAPAK